MARRLYLIPRHRLEKFKGRELIFGLIFSLIIISGCTKVPSDLYKPVIVFKGELKYNDVHYTMYVKGDLRNENSETILKDLKGVVTIQNQGLKISIPFEVPVILPFNKYSLKVGKSGTESEMKPFLDVFRVDTDKLIIGGVTSYSDEMKIDSRYVDIDIISYKTENIFDVIEGKENEDQ